MRADAGVLSAFITVTPNGADFSSEDKTYTTNDDGSYLIDEIAPGDYLFRVSILARNQYSRYRTLHQFVSVRSGELTEANFSFPNGGSTLNGQVTENGRPVARMPVRVDVTTPSGVERMIIYTEGSTGYYQFEALPGGEVELKVGGSREEPLASFRFKLPPDETLTFHADIVLVDREMKRPFELNNAAAAGNAIRVRELLDEDVDPNEADSMSRLALNSAVRGGNIHIIRNLLEHGADVLLAPESLPLAVAGKREAVVRLLLEHGADPNHQDKGSGSHSAPINPNGDAAAIQQMLFDHGKLIPAGFALRDPIYQHDAAVVKVFLEVGVDPNGTDEYGTTSLDIADEYGTDEIIGIIEAHGGMRSFHIDWRFWWLVYPTILAVALIPIALIANVKSSDKRSTTFLLLAYPVTSLFALVALALTWLGGSETFSVLEWILPEAPTHQFIPFIISLFCATIGYAVVQFIFLVVLLVRKPGAGKVVVTLLIAIPVNLTIAASIVYFVLFALAAAAGSV
jgi:hypothetical protein